MKAVAPWATYVVYSTTDSTDVLQMCTATAYTKPAQLHRYSVQPAQDAQPAAMDT